MNKEAVVAVVVLVVVVLVVVLDGKQRNITRYTSFLDASTHLYMRVCPSVGPSVGNAFLDASTHLYKRLCPSVGPSVRRSVVRGPSRVFFNRGN